MGLSIPEWATRMCVGSPYAYTYGIGHTHMGIIFVWDGADTNKISQNLFTILITFIG